MCCVVLKYIECSATVMWMWWSCNAYVLQSLCEKNGIENIKIYNMVERGGDGLVMTKLVKIVCYNTKY